MGVCGSGVGGLRAEVDFRGAYSRTPSMALTWAVNRDLRVPAEVDERGAKVMSERLFGPGGFERIEDRGLHATARVAGYSAGRASAAGKVLMKGWFRDGSVVVEVQVMDTTPVYPRSVAVVWAEERVTEAAALGAAVERCAAAAAGMIRREFLSRR